MDYHQSWSCEVATEDFTYHWCQLSVDFMSGCFFIDSSILCPIQEATISATSNSSGYSLFCFMYAVEMFALFSMPKGRYYISYDLVLVKN